MVGLKFFFLNYKLIYINFKKLLTPYVYADVIVLFIGEFLITNKQMQSGNVTNKGRSPTVSSRFFFKVRLISIGTLRISATVDI